MNRTEAAMLLAGVTSIESKQASAPTNVHLISGEVSGVSEDGIAKVAIDGLVFSEADDQYIDMDTLGGLEDGDVVTIMLSGEPGGGMTPLAIGGSGTIDRISLRVANIEADYVKTDELEANYAHISEGVIDNATIGHANVDGLSAAYAQIDGANITTATIRESWINKVMIQSGLIAQEGTVYTLDALQVNAENITAGTIDVERLIVTVNGEKYMVHIDSATSLPTYEKLDGNIIEDLTITADKIVAGAITADKITANNLVGTGGWINLRNGTFAYVNSTTGEGISWDGSHLSIGGESQLGNTTVNDIIDGVAEVSDAAKTATNYISQSSEGIKIANANPSTATTYQKLTSTNTEYYVSGNKRLEVSGEGLTAFDASGTDILSVDDDIRIGALSDDHMTMGSNSVDIYYGDTGVAQWVSGTSYAAGTLCRYENHTYYCRVAHTSSDSITPTSASDGTYWTQMDLISRFSSSGNTSSTQGSLTLASSDERIGITATKSLSERKIMMFSKTPEYVRASWQKQASAYLRVYADGLDTDHFSSVFGLAADYVFLSQYDIKPTPLPLNGVCQAYSASTVPKYSRQGRFVTVTGAVKPNSNIAAEGSFKIGTLPEYYRPFNEIDILCQGSGRNIWLLTVSTNGVLTGSRYRYGTTWSALDPNTWLPFHFSFLVPGQVDAPSMG